MPRAKSKPCGRCGEVKYVMFWPGGYICRPRHGAATHKAGICPGCGAEGLTPGIRSADGYLCGECSDPVEQWLDAFLTAQPGPGRRQVLERFAAWQVLRRLRGCAARRPLNQGRAETARSLPRRAGQFLGWLAENGLSLEHCRQLHLDHWSAEHRDRPYLIRLGDPPSPVLEPFADLLLQLLCSRPSMSMPTNLASPWLLPGRRPGNPMTSGTIRKRIISAGVPNVFARTAALRQLVLEAPAPVVAGMLGFHPVHTAFVTKQAGADWSRYAPGDHSPNLDRRYPRP